jgi:CRISPR-associated protein Cas1
MKNYYVLNQCDLEADEEILRVNGEKMRRIPVDQISALHLLAGYTLTSGVVDLAADHDFPIHAYNYYGVYKGTFFPPPVQPTGSLLIAQLESFQDEGRRLEIAGSILETSNEAANTVLEPFDLDLEAEIQGDTVEDLRLEEARIRKDYYAKLDTVLPAYWSIVERGRNPPKRPADAVLGFCNGLLYARTAGWIHRAGLNPRISYLHGQSRAKNPLALDLAEVLKPALSEGVLLEVAGSGKERSLVTEVNEGVYLNEKGRKFVIKQVEDMLERRVEPPNADRGDEIEGWAESVPRKLHRSLVEENTPYLPVVPCTLSSSTMQDLSSGRTSVPS